jgi:hypothetical protein
VIGIGDQISARLLLDGELRVGQTVAENFGLKLTAGESFLSELTD